MQNICLGEKIIVKIARNTTVYNSRALQEGEMIWLYTDTVQWTSFGLDQSEWRTTREKFISSEYINNSDDASANGIHLLNNIISREI